MDLLGTYMAVTYPAAAFAPPRGPCTRSVLRHGSRAHLGPTACDSMRGLSEEAQFLNMAWVETIAVTVFLPRPETSASWRIEAPARCATRIMSSRISDSLAARSALRPTTVRAAPISAFCEPLYFSSGPTTNPAVRGLQAPFNFGDTLAPSGALPVAATDLGAPRP
jgi:hypothetical protein